MFPEIAVDKSADFAVMDRSGEVIGQPCSARIGIEDSGYEELNDAKAELEQSRAELEQSKQDLEDGWVALCLMSIYRLFYHFYL